eukprot:762062-Hanusia_phi.AAC.2
MRGRLLRDGCEVDAGDPEAKHQLPLDRAAIIRIQRSSMSASAEVEGFKVSSYVLSKYEIHRVVGEGEYGVVYSARNIEDETPVAIKKIKDYAADEIRESLAKMILRELKMLQHFRGHDNIVSLVDVFIDDKDKHLYFVTELMDTTLHSVIYSKQPLTLQHIQFFAYQILRGLKFLHSAKVMHRDLKPGNILVNSACDVKICDLVRVLPPHSLPPSPRPSPTLPSLSPPYFSRGSLYIDFLWDGQVPGGLAAGGEANCEGRDQMVPPPLTALPLTMRGSQGTELLSCCFARSITISPSTSGR